MAEKGKVFWFSSGLNIAKFVSEVMKYAKRKRHAKVYDFQYGHLRKLIIANNKEEAYRAAKSVTDEDNSNMTKKQIMSRIKPV